MTDHQFTDDDVIKALECCNTPGACDKCPYYDEDADLYDDGCKYYLIEDVFSLVQRQKAEIERLQAVHADMTESLRLAAEANKDMSVELDAMRGAANSYKMHYEETERKYKIAVAEREANVEGFIETLKTIKAEAIKGFAERLKAESILRSGCVPWYDIQETIDTLVKEMTEDHNESQNT